MRIETDRLILRDWQDADLEPFGRMAEDPAVMEFLMPLDQAGSDALVGQIRAHVAEHGFGIWALELPGTAGFIGYAGLTYVAPGLTFSGSVEIGWRLARPYWGRGYATEAAEAALRDAFGRLGFDEVLAFTTPMNRRSRAVMERLGMMPHAIRTFDHPKVPEGHKLRAHILYRLPRAAWAARS
jgi:RimJ/RimL family protein N-acetyltransferase